MEYRYLLGWVTGTNMTCSQVYCVSSYRCQLLGRGHRLALQGDLRAEGAGDSAMRGEGCMTIVDLGLIVLGYLLQVLV